MNGHRKRSRQLATRWYLMFSSAFKVTPGLATAVLLLNFFGRVSMVLSPVAIAAFIDAFGEGWNVRLIVTGGLVALTMIATVSCMTLGANLGYSGLTGRMDLDVSVRIARLVNRYSSLKLVDDPDGADHLHRLTRHRNLLAAAPNLSMVVGADVLRLVLMLAVLATIEPVLLVVPVLSVAPFVSDMLASRYRHRTELVQSADARLADRLFELTTSLGSAKELRIFGAEATITEAFASSRRRVERATRRAAVVSFLIGSIGWLVYGVAFAGAVVVVLRSAVSGAASVGDVVLTVLLLQRAQMSANMIGQAISQLTAALHACAEYQWLEELAEESEQDGVAPPRVLRSGIEFSGVSFGYVASSHLALRDASVRLPAGATVAVVGENGAGKSTFVKLLTRLYQPTEGVISVDGAPLNEMNATEWRTTVAAVFQDFARFEAPIWEAIGLGDCSRMDDHDAVSTALDRAGAWHVPEAFPAGTMTPVGSSCANGVELSGGQWQSLAVARSKMRDTPLVYLMDEPSASLDAAAEAQLFERCIEGSRDARALNGGICVVVSHRLGAARLADQIIVLDGGQIAEVGSHEALMRSNGIYAGLFSLQARGYS